MFLVVGYTVAEQAFGGHNMERSISEDVVSHSSLLLHTNTSSIGLYRRRVGMGQGTGWWGSGA